ncbi:integrase [Clostridia bacterium]|nr:integrase [Clostridia bacterium]
MSNADKAAIVTALKSKYSITGLCKCLGLARTLYYYEAHPRKPDTEAENEVIAIFHASRKNYGQVKIQQKMRRKGYVISRHRIGCIMTKYGLVSSYCLRRHKQKSAPVNNDCTGNKLERNFKDKQPLEVVVSDLTYVDVNKKWHYICLLVELSHREIIGHAAGAYKDAELVRQAFYSVKEDLRNIGLFHTDRGSEFKNEIIEAILKTFGIERSLSRKGTPIDNAVVESMYDIVKTEFVYGETFESLQDLQQKLDEWVWWYNNERIHGSLNFMTPKESRQKQKIGVKSEVCLTVITDAE